MKALFLEAPETLSLIDRPLPATPPGLLTVETIMAGICASDQSLISGRNAMGRLPLVPGHECVGIVRDAPEAAGVSAGDWVVLFPSIGCGTCPACRDGRVNHCADLKVIGINYDGGCFAEGFQTHPDQIIALPASLHGPHAALVEPVAVGVHVTRRAAPVSGRSVLVIGTGVIGFLTALVARAQGAERIVLVDRLEARRAMAERLGFDTFLSADAMDTDPLFKVHGGAFDIVFDTVCVKETIAPGLAALRGGGRYVLVATPKSGTSIVADFPTAYRRELSLITSRNYVKDDFTEAIRLLDSGAFDPTPLVTKTVALSDFQSGLDALRQSPQDHIKIFVDPKG